MNAAEQDPYYLPIDHIRFLLEQAERSGLSAQAILRECRQSYSLAEIRDNRIGLLPQRDFVQLRTACVVGIWSRVARKYRAAMSKGDFHLMCHCLISSLTLGEAIDRVRRFQDLMGGRAGSLALETDGGRAHFGIELDVIGPDWRFFFICNAFATFMRLFEWLIGEELQAVYETSFPDTPAHRAMAAVFGETVSFGAPCHRISFAASLLERPVIRSAAELRQSIDGFPFSSIAPRVEGLRLAPRIEGLYRTAILQAAPLPRLGELAAAVGVSAATLRRRLEAESTSVQALKDAVRRDLSLQYLRDRRMPLTDVAARLGFSGPRAFGRAFREWNGTSPAGYRRECARTASGIVLQFAHKGTETRSAPR